MAKVASFVLIVLCGWASSSVSLAEPTTYGAMPPPATYPPPAKYEAPPPAPTPAPAKYEAAAPAAAVYEEKKYPMKAEYKKMEYGGKKYRRAVGDEIEEAKNDAKQTSDVTKEDAVSANKVQRLRDAVMKDIVSDPILRFRFGYRRYPYFGFGYRRFPYYGWGFRRFGYRRFWDGEQDVTSADPARDDVDVQNDEHLTEGGAEEHDAIAAPKRKWWSEEDLEEMMDAAPKRKWWIPEDMDAFAAPKRKWWTSEDMDAFAAPKRKWWTSEDMDAFAAPKRKWWNEDDMEEFMDAAPKRKWWTSEDMDAIATPKRKWWTPKDMDALAKRKWWSSE